MMIFILSVVVDGCLALLSQLEKVSDQYGIWKMISTRNVLCIFFSLTYIPYVFKGLLNNSFNVDKSNIIYVHFTKF